ncbi:MAG: hypothetical protein QME66_08695 [Candidatus Eisenbacteria bacterium]|nr:hypothetical protein [Candidatus Eisenbacteria bacterium]
MAIRMGIDRTLVMCISGLLWLPFAAEGSAFTRYGLRIGHCDASAIYRLPTSDVITNEPRDRSMLGFVMQRELSGEDGIALESGLYYERRGGLTRITGYGIDVNGNPTSLKIETELVWSLQYLVVHCSFKPAPAQVAWESTFVLGRKSVFSCLVRASIRPTLMGRQHSHHTSKMPRGLSGDWI